MGLITSPMALTHSTIEIKRDGPVIKNFVYLPLVISLLGD